MFNTEYSNVVVSKVNRSVCLDVDGQIMSVAEFAEKTHFPAKKIAIELAKIKNTDKKNRFASDVLYLSRRGFTGLMQVFEHGGIRLTALDIMEITNVGRTRAYLRGRSFEAGESTLADVLSMDEIPADTKKKPNWHGLSGDERPYEPFKPGTWEAENYGVMSSPATPGSDHHVITSQAFWHGTIS